MEHIIAQIPGQKGLAPLLLPSSRKNALHCGAGAGGCEFCIVSGTDHDIDAIASAMWFRRYDWLPTTRLGPSAGSVDKYRRQITMGTTSTQDLMGPKLLIILGQALLATDELFLLCLLPMSCTR
jgi:hypothetical protein